MRNSADARSVTEIRWIQPVGEIIEERSRLPDSHCTWLIPSGDAIATSFSSSNRTYS